MRFFFGFLFLIIVFVFVSKAFSLLLRGELFKEGAFKRSLQESGRNLWWGMKMFVVLWLLYLIFIYLVRNR